MAHKPSPDWPVFPEAKLSEKTLEQLSHDFRSPLNIIIGFSELMLDEVPGKINLEQRHNLNDILASGQRLLDLVNNLFGPSSAGPGSPTVIKQKYG